MVVGYQLGNKCKEFGIHKKDLVDTESDFRCPFVSYGPAVSESLPEREVCLDSRLSKTV